MMKRTAPAYSIASWMLLIALLAPFLPVTAQAPEPYRVTGLWVARSDRADRARMVRATVVRIVDGDTIKVRIESPPHGVGSEETVRLIGVDTPETVDPRKPVERFGREAAEYVLERLLGQSVLLAFDGNLRDVYGRLLAYVYMDGGGCFNLELVAEGYGFAYVKYPFFFMDEFRRAERSARSAGKGLWEKH